MSDWKLNNASNFWRDPFSFDSQKQNVWSAVNLHVFNWINTLALSIKPTFFNMKEFYTFNLILRKINRMNIK